jgi:hypothetical protein
MFQRHITHTSIASGVHNHYFSTRIFTTPKKHDTLKTTSEKRYATNFSGDETQKTPEKNSPTP